MTSSTDSQRGQVSTSAAQTYDDVFVPALFGQWPSPVLKAAQVQPGDAVLDVGCGTGIVAAAAWPLVGPAGSVTAIDPNDGMLAVAGQRMEPIAWQKGKAEDLPFADRTFDRTICQFALMFFEDRNAGLDEMVRVTRSGGSLTVTTWASIEESPGYAALAQLLARLFGDEVAAAVHAPFAIGAKEQLAGLVEAAAGNAKVSREIGTARFESLGAWIHTEIRGWTLADAIDDDQLAELNAAAEVELAAFAAPDGRIAFDAPALIATATVP